MSAPLHSQEPSPLDSRDYHCIHCIPASNTRRRQAAFEGKVVLIVGASSGIGRALALRLAREGASVVATARRKERLDALAAEIARSGGLCQVVAADAEDPEAAENVVASVVESHGCIDLAVLNAGGAPALDLRKMTAREVTAYMRSNYDVTVNYLLPVAHQMVRQGDGVVAHTNSLAGFAGIPLQGPYSAAKGALRLLVDTCRIEFGSSGVRFVSLYPGFVATEATAGDGMPAPLEISEERAIDHVLRAIRRERRDCLFPFAMACLVRLLRVLPKALSDRILRASMPSVSEA